MTFPGWKITIDEHDYYWREGYMQIVLQQLLLGSPMTEERAQAPSFRAGLASSL